MVIILYKQPINKHGSGYVQVCLDAAKIDLYFNNDIRMSGIQIRCFYRILS